jgi:hypothetical protein
VAAAKEKSKESKAKYRAKAEKAAVGAVQVECTYKPFYLSSETVLPIN